MFGNNLSSESRKLFTTTKTKSELSCLRWSCKWFQSQCSKVFFMIYIIIYQKYLSCNACRLFFRRAVLNEANYECMLKNSCLKRTQLADIKKCKERFSIMRLESFHSIHSSVERHSSGFLGYIFRICIFKLAKNQ